MKPKFKSKLNLMNFFINLLLQYLEKELKIN